MKEQKTIDRAIKDAQKKMETREHKHSKGTLVHFVMPSPKDKNFEKRLGAKIKLLAHNHEIDTISEMTGMSFEAIELFIEMPYPTIKECMK